MKHTYLCPLEDGELWLWRASRADCADLFGDPDVDDSQGVDWDLNARVGDALAKAREELHRRLESRDQICIGRHYAVPGSLCDVARGREREADTTVRSLTLELWDAPPLSGSLFAIVWAELSRTAGRDGRDDWAEISAFLDKHRDHRVVPVWM